MPVFPPLRRDPSFWGITATQFLGAFNDNIFKMLLMLICADYVADRAGGGTNPYFDPWQTAASLLFAFAFVMFSGVAGFLSDRFRKRRIIVASKIAEIGVMTAGLLVFLTGQPGSNAFIFSLFAVLFLMGVQSAFFGPSKFGILPEIFSDSDLPVINGVMLATTFLAIIFGTALGGALKQVLGDQLWLISLACVGLGIIGTATATLLRQSPPAQSDLQFSMSGWFVEPAVWKQVLADRLLLRVLLVYSVFWFVGGVVALTITLVGQIQMQLPESLTAAFNAGVGLGIGLGSVSAAWLSREDVRMDLVRTGSIGLCAGMSAAAIAAVLPLPPVLRLWLFGSSLFVGGFFGGWVAVPLQVFIQAHPPDELKGRVIAVMNLMTWIGILLASCYYFAVLGVTGFRMDPSWILLSAGIIMLLSGLAGRLQTQEHLKQERTVAAD
jgi:acyl-[acyl-carrier-protein]-phospholipid O-acyltransferase/long-chain-fatty-acid--[acyl-carrier-protein] ligase